MPFNVYTYTASIGLSQYPNQCACLASEYMHNENAALGIIKEKKTTSTGKACR
jgi:hypothetical protein